MWAQTQLASGAFKGVISQSSCCASCKWTWFSVSKGLQYIQDLSPKSPILWIMSGPSHPESHTVPESRLYSEDLDMENRNPNALCTDLPRSCHARYCNPITSQTCATCMLRCVHSRSLPGGPGRNGLSQLGSEAWWYVLHVARVEPGERPVWK